MANFNKKGTIQRTASILLAAFVVTALVLFAPAQAVSVDLNAPNAQKVGKTVNLQAKVDISEQEVVDALSATVTLSGPVSDSCTFTLAGSENCARFDIVDIKNRAYGYGAGYTGAPGEDNELQFKVDLLTAGLPKGTYTIEFTYNGVTTTETITLK